MELIRFPGLGLEFNISKYVINIGNITIYKYALCIVIGIVLGLFLSKISREKFGIDYEFVLETFVGGIIFGIIGARAYYVIFNLSKFIGDPSKIFAIHDGGLAIYGGMAAISIFLYIKCRLQNVNFLDVCDYLVPYLAFGQAIGRWGNFFNIEAYGTQTNSILRMGIETASGYMEVHPVFLYESICTFLIFITLRIMQKNRKFKGQILYVYFILYGFIRMFLECLRVDSLMLFGVRVSCTLSIGIFVVFSIIYWKNILKKSKV